MRFLHFMLMAILLSSNSHADELLSFDKTKLRERVVLECEQANPQQIEACVTRAGVGVLAKMEISGYNDVMVEPLCLSKSGGRMLAYLSCFDTQLSIKKKSPLAQYSTLILRTDQFRASWVSICKNKHGLDVSSCVKSKTASFYQAWTAYINLEKNPEKTDLFESCIAKQRDEDWDKFVTCFHR